MLSVTGEDIYNTNRLYNRILNELKGFPIAEIKSDKYRLYSRHYINWDEECQDNETSEMRKLAENMNPINTLANAQLFFMVICFLSLLIMGITTPIFIIIRHCMILRGEKKAVYKVVIVSTGMRFVSFIFILLKICFLIS